MAKNLFNRPFSVEKVNEMTGWQKLSFLTLVILALYFAFRYVSWWFEPQHLPFNYVHTNLYINLVVNIALFSILSFAVFAGLFIKMASWVTLLSMSTPKPVKPMKGLKVAFVTCFVPGNEPVSLLKTTLKAMTEVEYPHDSWVLDEGDDDEVKALCKELGVNYFTRKGIKKYNASTGSFRARTKAGNLNSWRDQHEKNYDIVAQIDMDHVPEKDYFNKTLGYFKDPTVGFVGMPQIYQNLKNWVAKGAAQQTYFFYGPILKGLFGSDIPFLIGTSHVYRVDAMREINGYTTVIAEDHITGLYMHGMGWKSVYVPEILARGNGPTSWASFFNQQMRWSYGMYEILFYHALHLLPKLPLLQRVNYFLLQLYYFTGVATFVGSLLLMLYFVTGLTPANVPLEDWLLYAGPSIIISFILQWFMLRFHIDPKNEPKVTLAGILVGIGSSMVFAKAFITFIAGRRHQYLVTPKDAIDMPPLPSNVNTFHFHNFVGSLMLICLSIGVYLNNTSYLYVFWGVVFVVSMYAIFLSNYYVVYLKALSILIKILLAPFQIILFPARQLGRLPVLRSFF